MDKETTFNTFAERLVQNHAKKMQARAVKNRKSKKSRQIFTFSNPAKSQLPGTKALGEGIEIYESIGGSLGYKEIEGTTVETYHPPPAVTSENSRLLPADVSELSPRMVPVPRENNRPQCDLNTSCDRQTFFPESPLHIHLPGTCFPRAKSQPDLFYIISNQSMPLKRYPSAHNFGESTKKTLGVTKWPDDAGFVSADDRNCQTNLCGTNPNLQILEDGLKQRLSPGRCLENSRTAYSKQDQCTSEMKKTVLLGCHELKKMKNERTLLTKEMTSTLTGISIMPTRGRLMTYAKFNSSFKITEDVYEDVNHNSISLVPTVTESFADFSFRRQDFSKNNLDYIHKLNPDFDENQSLTEALTAIRSPCLSSSLTSATLRSGLISKVYRHFAKSVNQDKSESEEQLPWIRIPKAVTRSDTALHLEKKGLSEYDYVDVCAGAPMDQKSRFTENLKGRVSCVSLSRVVSAFRKEHLAELKMSLQNGRNQVQNETALWSSSTPSLSPVQSDPMEMICGHRMSPRNISDVVSQSGVFNNSSVELFKRPFWRFKISSAVDGRRSELVQGFLSKAHHYMCGKDYHRTTMNRCYFLRSPTVRLIDQSTQFPNPDSTFCDRVVKKEIPENSEILVESRAFVVHEGSSGDREHENNDHVRSTRHGCDEEVRFGCSSTFQSQTFETNASDPTCGCHKLTSKMSFTGINSESSPAQNGILYCADSRKLEEKLQNSFHSDTVYENARPDSYDHTPVLKPSFEGEDFKQQHETVSHSFRALCDKRRIRIKYENGSYTVYKEVDSTRRRTVWSLLTGKATNLLSAVIPKKSPAKKYFHCHN